MTTAASPRPLEGSGGSGRTRDRFREWRYTRPFWGSAVSILGGIEIYLAAAAPLDAGVMMQSVQGLLTVVVFLVTVILGGVTLYQPHLRSLTGLLILVIGPLSIMATNLGGFVIGAVLLMVGGGLILAWAPAEDPLDLEYIAGESTAVAPVAPVAPAPAAAAAAAAPSPAGAGPTSSDPDSPDHLGQRSTTSYESIDPIPSSSIGASTRPVTEPSDELAAQRAALKAAQRPSQKKKKRPAPRTGLAGVLDTMFGTRKPPPRKPGQKRTPPTGPKRTPPPGKRPAGQRPPGSGSAGSPGAASSTLPPLERPAGGETSNARTWIIIPMLLVALASPALLAGPASASSSDGPFDWLFPPSTPAPTAPAPAPTPSATPGFVLPTLPNLFPSADPAPTPTPSATDLAVPPAQCPDTTGMTGTTTGGKDAVDAAAAIQACVTAAEADDSPTVKADTGATPRVSNVVSTLKATRMDMHDFSYVGVATVDSPSGPVETLHFSASSIDIEGMNQTYPFEGGTTGLENANGKATLKGNVELYVTRFKSNIYGLIPLEFSVDGLQPPLVLPEMFFTDATSVIALVTCDQILLPDLKLTVRK